MSEQSIFKESKQNIFEELGFEPREAGRLKRKSEIVISIRQYCDLNNRSARQALAEISELLGLVLSVDSVDSDN